MRLSPSVARWRDPGAYQNRAHHADSNHAHAASGRRSHFHLRKPDHTPPLLPTLSRTPRAPLRRVPGSSNSFFATPAQTIQRARKRHRRQRHSGLPLPRQCHLAQCGVRLSAHKLFKSRALQLPRARRTHRARRQTAGLLAQGQPVIDGRATDVKQAVRCAFAQAFIERLQHPLPQIYTVAFGHTTIVAE